jgi:hypothetical protein
VESSCLATAAASFGETRARRKATRLTSNAHQQSPKLLPQAKSIPAGHIISHFMLCMYALWSPVATMCYKCMNCSGCATRPPAALSLPVLHLICATGPLCNLGQGLTLSSGSTPVLVCYAKQRYLRLTRLNLTLHTQRLQLWNYLYGHDHAAAPFWLRKPIHICPCSYFKCAPAFASKLPLQMIRTKLMLPLSYIRVRPETNRVIDDQT